MRPDLVVTHVRRDVEAPAGGHMMQDRVRYHGGYREGEFHRSAVRRTLRSYMRRDMPHSHQLPANLSAPQGTPEAAEQPEVSGTREPLLVSMHLSDLTKPLPRSDTGLWLPG